MLQFCRYVLRIRQSYTYYVKVSGFTGKKNILIFNNLLSWLKHLIVVIFCVNNSVKRVKYQTQSSKKKLFFFLNQLKLWLCTYILTNQSVYGTNRVSSTSSTDKPVPDNKLPLWQAMAKQHYHFTWNDNNDIRMFSIRCGQMVVK